MCIAEQKHNQLTEELQHEKHKHHEYMEKSDEFVNLLETDRQKLKLQLEEEKTLADNTKRVYEKLKKETSEEIDKLKKFSMLLVEEKQVAMKKDQRFNEKIQGKGYFDGTFITLSYTFEQKNFTNLFFWSNKF